MGDLSDVVNRLSDSIYKNYEEEERLQPRRAYLGGSLIGEECRRKLWYGFRWVGRPNFSGRILRLFETGHREEARIINNLRAVGCMVLEIDPGTGRQWRFDLLGGHVSCGFDGVIRGVPEATMTWHLLECKTFNQKYFNQLIKKGVQEAKPVHYAQMQIYMHAGELKRALYVAVCKNDDSIYTERVRYDKKFAEALERKAKAVVYAESPPEKISEKHDFYMCRFCDYLGWCHGKRMPEVNCRTCAHAMPSDAGGWWVCAKEQPNIGKPLEDLPCHIYLPSLLHWEKPVDGSPEHVEYEDFINCAAEGFPGSEKPHYSSYELFEEKK